MRISVLLLVLIHYQILVGIGSKSVAREIFFVPTDSSSDHGKLSSESAIGRNSIGLHFFRYSSWSSHSSKKNKFRGEDGDEDEKRVVPTGSNPLHNR